MSEYIKHTWQDGETIDAPKLNNIETGIAEAKKKAEVLSVEVGKVSEEVETLKNKKDPAFSEFTESTQFPDCYYRTVNTRVTTDGKTYGNITETEWLNPPIVYGEVFRTTRKKGNAPIYKLLLSTGVLSPESTKSIDAQTAFQFVEELQTEFALVPSEFLRVYSTFYSWDNPKTVDGVTISVWGSGLYVNASLDCPADSDVTGYETCLLDIEFTANWTW